ncbi:MAG: polymer-forming cytoskeletal protein [Acidobacteria bacterium]|nr:MAG: polymer-forming cytoskeletal protein [Acidobacteriota bacterium]
MKEKEMNGFLDRGTVFKGDLVFEDLLRIDGKFEGTIRSDSELIIGDSADVKGEVIVDAVTINGRVDGKVTAKSRIEISNRARVTGELHSPVLSIQDGAVFDGTVRMGSGSQVDKKTKAPAGDKGK